MEQYWLLAFGIVMVANYIGYRVIYVSFIEFSIDFRYIHNVTTLGRVIISIK